MNEVQILPFWKNSKMDNEWSSDFAILKEFKDGQWMKFRLCHFERIQRWTMNEVQILPFWKNSTMDNEWSSDFAILKEFKDGQWMKFRL